jgi:outer membrane murein-binding lipoprotein Lpp
VSEHQADSTPDVSGDHVDTGVKATAGSHASDSHVDAPKLVPDQGEGCRADMPKREAPKLGAPGRITIMAPSRDSGSRDSGQRDDASRERAAREHSWEDFVNAEPKLEQAEKAGRSRMLAIAAMIALGITVGAVGGSVAMSGLGRLFAADETKSTNQALEEHIARLDGEVAALKAEVDRNAKQSAAARAKSADRLDKLEKGQAEPNARIAKLSETVEKLRTTPPPAPAAAPAPAPAPVASLPAKDVTGSINAPVPTPAPKPDVARLPTVEGWRILDIAGGGATIEGRAGIFEVYAGDPVPGLGRVDAVRKQDGRWTVVTSRGLIVAR